MQCAVSPKAAVPLREFPGENFLKAREHFQTHRDPCPDRNVRLIQTCLHIGKSTFNILIDFGYSIFTASNSGRSMIHYIIVLLSLREQQ